MQVAAFLPSAASVAPAAPTGACLASSNLAGPQGGDALENPGGFASLLDAESDSSDTPGAPPHGSAQPEPDSAPAPVALDDPRPDPALPANVRHGLEMTMAAAAFQSAPAEGATENPAAPTPELITCFEGEASAPAPVPATSGGPRYAPIDPRVKPSAPLGAPVPVAPPGVPATATSVSAETAAAAPTAPATTVATAAPVREIPSAPTATPAAPVGVPAAPTSVAPVYDPRPDPRQFGTVRQAPVSTTKPVVPETVTVPPTPNAAGDVAAVATPPVRTATSVTALPVETAMALADTPRVETATPRTEPEAPASESVSISTAMTSRVVRTVSLAAGAADPLQPTSGLPVQVPEAAGPGGAIRLVPPVSQAPQSHAPTPAGEVPVTVAPVPVRQAPVSTTKTVAVDPLAPQAGATTFAAETVSSALAEAVPAAPPRAATDEIPAPEFPDLRVQSLSVRWGEPVESEPASRETTASVRQLSAWPRPASPVSLGAATAVRDEILPAPTANAPTAAASAAAAASADDATKAAVVTAVPTLAQMLVELAPAPRVTNGRARETVNAAADPFAGQFPADGEVETITLELPAFAVAAPQATAGTTAGAGSAAALVERAATAAATPATGETPAREIPAAGRGKNSPVRWNGEGKPESKNFLSVDEPKVAERVEGLGTRIAERVATMATKTLLSAAPEESRELLPTVSSLTAMNRNERSATGAAPAAENPQVRNYAAAAVKEVLAAAEKLVPPKTSIELRLQAFDQENLRIQLVWREGTIHARFVTETPELQQALTREWESSTGRFAEKGLKFGDASFEQRESGAHSGGSNAAYSQEQHGRRGRSYVDRDFPEFALPSFLSGVTGRAASVPVDLPSLGGALQPNLAAARGLRVWA